MRPGTFATRQLRACWRHQNGSTLSSSLLFIVVIVILTLCLFYGIPTGPAGTLKLGLRTASSSSSTQVSGLAELVSHRWAAARVEVIRELKAVSLSESPSEALDHFITARPERLQRFAEVEKLAESTLGKLTAKQHELSDAHYQSLLPPEVLPELAQAIKDHIRTVERIQSEIRTLRSQTLPDIETRLRKLTEATRIKELLSGHAAAQRLWHSGVNDITTTLSGE